MVVKSNAYAFDLLDQLVEQLLPLDYVSVICCFKLVPYILKALVTDHCISLLEHILQLQSPLGYHLDLLGPDDRLVFCFGAALVDWGQQLNNLFLPGLHCLGNQVSLRQQRTLEVVHNVFVRLRRLGSNFSAPC